MSSSALFGSTSRPSLPQSYELRNVTINPTTTAPAIDFMLVTGIHLPGASEACQRFAYDFGLYHLDLMQYLTDLRDHSKYDQDAYGYLHPATFGQRAFERLNEADFAYGAIFTLHLMPILKYKIDSEVAKGWTRFMISGLDTLLRATREFSKQIAMPKAVLCFRNPLAPSLSSRANIEQLFTARKLVEVPIGSGADETYERMVTETVCKRGMPSSPRYSPSP